MPDRHRVPDSLALQKHSKAGIFARVQSSPETVSLAPAAGAGIGKILADRLLADPTFVDAMVEAVMAGLRATRSFWTGKGETAQLITEPDSKTQLQAFALILAHMEGEPIKRIIHQHLGTPGQIDPMAALQDSPALMQAVERELAKAKFRDRNRKTRPADQAAIEVD